MREYSVKEAAIIFKEYYITASEERVTRWIRDGRLPGSRTTNRKIGWKIREDDLYEFINYLRPGTDFLEDKKEGISGQINRICRDLQNINDMLDPDATDELHRMDEIDLEKADANVIRDKSPANDEESSVNSFQELAIESISIELLNQILHELKTLVDIQKSYQRQEVQVTEFNSNTDELNDRIKNLVENKAGNKFNAVKTKQVTQLTNEFTLDYYFKLLDQKVIDTVSREELEHHYENIYDYLFDDKGSFNKCFFNKNGHLKSPFDGKKRQNIETIFSHVVQKKIEEFTGIKIKLK